MKSMKKYLALKIITAILFIVVGVIMIMHPNKVISIITWLLGIGIIIIGAALVVADVMAKEVFTRNGTLLTGVIFIVMGIALLANPDIGNILLPLCIGAMIIADSIIRMQIGAMIRGFGGSSYLTVISVLTIVLGILCIFNPMKTSALITTFLGIVVIIEAISSLVDTYYVKKYVKEIEDNIIDV